MASTVKENIKTDWEKVQVKGAHRFKRIQEILKAAAAETLTEMKDGSNEIQLLGRKSLGEMIAQVKAQEAMAANGGEAVVMESSAGVLEPNTSAIVVETEPTVEAEAPTWRQIFSDLFSIVNARKGDWTEQLLAKLKIQLARFDTEMSAEYGERYRPFGKVVGLIRSFVDTAYARVSQNVEQQASAPVEIEVLEEEGSGVMGQTAEA